VYTAPFPPHPNLGGSGSVVTIKATLIGTNYKTAVPQTVTIRLVPPGAITPPAETPSFTTPAFVLSPKSPTAKTPVQLIASGACGGALVNGVCPPTASAITRYAWSFGDGSADCDEPEKGCKNCATHTFNEAGSFDVTLTVTNERGLSASTSQTVAIGAATLPTPKFTFSPANPVVGQNVFFSAIGSTAGAGHTIVSYRWTFGDGVEGANVNDGHAYSAAGTFRVQLTVTDDAGQSVTSEATEVTVGTGNPVPVITFSPKTPAATTTVSFDSSGTTYFNGATPTTYQWTFGDGVSSTLAKPTHAYAAAGIYSVILTVTDSQGRVGTTTVTVTVS
jgi:PKD repeat protein